MSYWIYQHLGNLTPEALREDGLLDRVQGAADAGPVLREFASRAGRQADAGRWSYCRDLGATRLLVLDTRAGRVLDPRRRSMVDQAEWDWIESHATGGCDHLLLASSVPVLLAPGMHGLEAWSEAVTGGAWGRVASTVAEKLRQSLDLEHWAAFHTSFLGLTGLIRSVGSGERGAPPASIVALSGDVHHAYLAAVAFPRGTSVRSAVYQAVCSPIRNPLDSNERRAIRAGWSRLAHVIGAGLAAAAGVPRPDVSWRLLHPEPWFDNQIATLELQGREAVMRIERTAADGTSDPRLDTVFERRLA